MAINKTNIEKREGVRKNYDLIAKQYGKDFGTYIEDLNIYDAFEHYLQDTSIVLDLGCGTGRTYAYFHKKGYKYIGLDFSEEMKKNAYKIHGEFSYLVEDMMNVKKHFKENSIDAVFAVYSLFHLPNDDLKILFSDVHDILKTDGLFLFSYQIGNGEEMADEPYLGENGKNVLYMNYSTDEEIQYLLKQNSFQELFRREKIETHDMTINASNVTTAFVLVKKKK